MPVPEFIILSEIFKKIVLVNKERKCIERNILVAQMPTLYTHSIYTLYTGWLHVKSLSFVSASPITQPTYVATQSYQVTKKIHFIELVCFPFSLFLMKKSKSTVSVPNVANIINIDEFFLSWAIYSAGSSSFSMIFYHNARIHYLRRIGSSKRLHFFFRELTMQIIWCLILDYLLLSTSSYQKLLPVIHHW